MQRVLLLTDELGGTDCEAVGGGLLAQPVNALTSFAFVVAGLIIAIRGLRSRQSRWPAVTYGSILVLVGLGSVAFHGPQPTGSQLMHDTPIAAALLFILVFNVQKLVGLRQAWMVGGVVLGLITILFAVAPTAGAVVTGVFAAGAFVSEFFVYRKTRDAPAAPRAVGYLWLLAVLGAALIGYWFGRTGSIVCDPDSLLQPHGAWHLLAAAAFALWGFINFPSEEREES